MATQHGVTHRPPAREGRRSVTLLVSAACASKGRGRSGLIAPARSSAPFHATKCERFRNGTKRAAKTPACVGKSGDKLRAARRNLLAAIRSRAHTAASAARTARDTTSEAEGNSFRRVVMGRWFLPTSWLAGAWRSRCLDWLMLWAARRHDRAPL
eukprot:1182800-Prorocentrum_minimum.AAC.1